MAQHDDQADHQARALDALLPHAPRLGWSRAALEAGLADLGLPRAEAGLLFGPGPFRLIEAWARLNDRRMTAAAAEADFEGLRTPGRVRAVVELRLGLLAPHKQALRSAVGLLATPFGLPSAWRIEARTVDAIWKAAGDASSDFSRHSKRAILAAIHTATLAYWLRNDGTSIEEAMAFFDRRLAMLPKKRKRASSTVSEAA
ncbi:COQ9 family protein [Acetobacteraceae bacterium H6797]|nr:COQ9 family protein [Acetobacteraceae bacterium H6797]